MNHNCNSTTIHTGLYGIQAKAVIDGVHGQLSDGKWENSPGYDKYWTNFAVETADDGEVVFKVNAEGYIMWCKRLQANPFYYMSDADFKKWVATKIKAVANDERKDREEFGAWDRRNIDHTSLYLGHADEEYGPVVTVADIYCTYEALLGRNIGTTKYDPSTICRVFGTKKTDEEAAKVKSIREAKECLKAKYAQKRAELQKAKNEAVAKLEKELQDNITKLVQEENAEIAKLQLA